MILYMILQDYLKLVCIGLTWDFQLIFSPLVFPVGIKYVHSRVRLICLFLATKKKTCYLRFTHFWSFQISSWSLPYLLYHITQKTYNDTFKQFYTHFYASEPLENMGVFDEFLSTIELPKPSKEDKDSFHLPFTQTEKKERKISGFPPEFYREFKDLLLPRLMEVINLWTLLE